MTKRQAKRNACQHAALILQNALDCGWELDARYPDQADEAKVLAALDELIAELFRRGKTDADRRTD